MQAGLSNNQNSDILIDPAVPEILMDLAQKAQSGGLSL